MSGLESLVMALLLCPGPRADTTAKTPAGPGPWARRLTDLQRECDGGAMDSCVVLGRVYADGEVVDEDGDRALALWKKACLAGHAPACDEEAMLTHGRTLNAALNEHQSPDAANTLADAAAKPFHDRARELAARRCEDGLAVACVGLAMQLGTATPVSAENGARADVFAKRARDLAEKGCQAGDSKACVLWRDLLRYGPGPKDPQRALDLTIQGCAAGDARACGEWAERNRRAWMRKEESKIPDAEIYRLYTKACEAGESFYCEQAAASLSQGVGVPVDRKRALALYEKVWFETGRAPEHMADLFASEAPSDLSAAIHLCERLCTDRAEQCDSLATLRKLKH